MVVTGADALIALAANPPPLTPAARADAQRLLADTLTVGAAGAASPEALRVTTAIARAQGGGEARLLGGGRISAPEAAFCNGFAIHCLEWDAVHEPAVVHALSAVTAALLAASDRAGGSSADAFVEALAVGVDIACGLGISATGPMRFFRPATAGVIGATLAVARLEALDATQMADAAGLAYSFAGGTMQAHVEASVALPLQIAHAARAALTAVDLARAGLGGPHDWLDGPFGYRALIEPLDMGGYLSALGTVWRISEVSIKPYPSGRASHGALGSLETLRSAKGIRADTVAAIELHAPPLVQRLVGRPFDPAAAPGYRRLCLAFLAPLMLRDGRIDPRIERTEEALARRVTVIPDGNPDQNALSPQRLVVVLKDGTRIERPVPATLGSPAAPLSDAQVQAKMALCQTLAAGADARLFDQPLSFATEPL
jgi:2-methylcitrate dehydratase PrpD